MRKGLLKEVRKIFDAASAMAGAGDPEYINNERKRITKLEKEVLKLLRRGDADVATNDKAALKSIAISLEALAASVSSGGFIHVMTHHGD